MASDKSKKRIAKRYGDMPDKWDDWHVRLPDPKEQLRIIDLYRKSGSKSKSEFVRARLLGEHFKVITVDKSAVDYYRKLSELTAEVHKIGTNYNQVVRLLHITERETTMQILLQELIRLTKELTALQEQTVSLTIDYRESDDKYPTPL
ncbi:plasmid mobilization protein [Bacteroides heparinolyticus]|uniref:plasmid mobilization protein n=1 Tax=Prevotella heparinolytica TaxID=28113 RepID=UPI0035A0438B